MPYKMKLSLSLLLEYLLSGTIVLPMTSLQANGSETAARRFPEILSSLSQLCSAQEFFKGLTCWNFPNTVSLAVTMEMTSFSNIVCDDDVGTRNKERDMTSSRNYDRLPLHEAILKRNKQKVDELLKNTSLDLHMQDEDGNIPLHYAAITGNLGLVKKLITKNMKTVNTVNKRGQTALHLAAQHGAELAAMELLDNEANKEAQDMEKLTPILTAAKHGCPLTVDVLLDKNANSDVKDINGKTVIHLATENNNVKVLQVLLRHEKSTIKHYTCTKKLLNELDNEGKTPLLVAAQSGHLECMKLLLEKGADIYKTCGDQRVREEDVMKNALHFAAEGGWTKVVTFLLESEKGFVAMKDGAGKTALHSAVIHNMKRTTEILLQEGADVNAVDKGDRTPLSYAAEKGLFKCTKVLLSKGAKLDMEETSNDKLTPVQFAAQKGHSEVVQLLAEEDKHNTILTKTFGRKNSLDIAIENDHKDTVMTIIHTNQWQGVLCNQTEGFQSPMRKLIRYMPDAAREVLNRCTDVNESGGKFQVEFNYKFMDDTMFLSSWRNDGNTEVKTIALPVNEPYTSNSEKIRDNHPLMIMVTSGRKELLNHPLTTSLLKKKWHSVGLLFHLINFLIFAIYLAMLTGFILDVKAPFQFANVATDSEACSKENIAHYKIPRFAATAKNFVITLASIEIVKEILELILMFSGKFWRYFMVTENSMELITYITSILFVVNTNDCEDTGYRPQWQWTCGTVSVFLAWINLLLFTQKHEWLGIYVVMLNRIVKVFLKFFFVFSVLIVAFSVSFHCLFQNQEQFATFWTSLVKTTAMMIGELDFGTIFYEGDVHYDIISYVFFYMFMLFMTIVIINLLIGLAVSNIQEFQEKAGLKKKEMQVKFALAFERRYTAFKKFVPDTWKQSAVDITNDAKETLKPNEHNWVQKKIGESWGLTEDKIRRALNTEIDGTGKELMQLSTKVTNLETNLKVKMGTIDTQLKSIIESLGDLKEIVDATSGRHEK